MVTRDARLDPTQTGAAPQFVLNDLGRAVGFGLIAVLGMSAGAFVFQSILRSLTASATVDESVTITLASLLLLLSPFVAYIFSSSTLRPLAKTHKLRAVLAALVAAVIVYGGVAAQQYIFQAGPFESRPTLQMTLGEVENGVLVEEIAPGGAAEQAGLQVGDIITAIRRDPVDRADLLARIAQSSADDPFRLRILRDGEEMQMTVRVTVASDADPGGLLPGLVIALAVTVVAVFWPGSWTPYLLLVIFLSPLLVGYFWLVIATLSYRTQGLLPSDANGNIGGLTLDNWRFLTSNTIAGFQFDVARVTLNSLLIAVWMTVTVLLVSSMAGYALSRMNFPGRRTFLSFTLILHGFPAVTLIIPIFFVLLNLANLPGIGRVIGFNSPGGIALVMVAFELPLGIWLMKGFFDQIPWDIERSALIDGASRWRTFWEILLPQIRPGILALGVFAFISGWNAYIIPATYSIGRATSNLPVVLRELVGETSPVAWNQVAAVGLFQLAPIIVFFVFAQEYLLNIYAGGTKGTT
jgi:inositol-phosphate transport system permease protein